MSSRERHHTELPIPNGWFAVALSKDLVAGEVKRMRYFDEELVLFRTRSGAGARARRLLRAPRRAPRRRRARGRRDARAARSTAGSTTAPASCVEIPYCKKIPPRARVRAWEVRRAQPDDLRLAPRRGQAARAGQVPMMPEIGASRLDRAAQPSTRGARAHAGDAREQQRPGALPVRARESPGAARRGPLRRGRPLMRMVSDSQTETPVGSFDTTLERDSWGLGLAAVRICGIPGRGAPDVLVDVAGRPRAHPLALALHRHEEPRRRRGRGVRPGSQRRA